MTGIERAELLLADPQWLAAECEAQAERWVAWEAERRKIDLRNAIRSLREAGCDDLVAALEAGRMTAGQAFFEMRCRRDAQNRARIEATGPNA